MYLNMARWVSSDSGYSTFKNENLYDSVSEGNENTRNLFKKYCPWCSRCCCNFGSNETVSDDIEASFIKYGYQVMIVFFGIHIYN